MEVTIRARGHKNIRAQHETTWQLTKETHLTPKGDCIIAVDADTAAMDLPDEFKEYLQQGNWIEMEISIGQYSIKGGDRGILSSVILILLIWSFAAAPIPVEEQ